MKRRNIDLPPVSKPWTTRTVLALGLAAGTLGFLATWLFRPAATPPEIASVPPSERPPRADPAVPTASADPLEGQWEALSRAPAGPPRTRKLAAFLERLARTDPQKALALAQRERNWLARDELRDAALRGWGAVAPDDAADWAMGQGLMGDRMRCVSAVLTGAAENPAQAIRVGLRVCAADPSPSGDYGHSLINALVERAGDFSSAVQFAAAAGMVDRQSFLLDSAFYQWAQHEPDRALAALKNITDEKTREAALKGVVAGWAEGDSRKLAAYAQNLPEGPERSKVLAVALPQWVQKDPEAALHWMNEAEPHPDFDKGVAALALLPSLLHSRPEMSMDLTDTICDAAQRTLIKSNVFYQWAMKDPDAARRYAETNPNPEHREMLLADLETLKLSKNQP